MFEHIVYDLERNMLTVLDQRKLPGEEIFLECHTGLEVATAIENLTVRGAPLIGVSAAYGILLEWINLCRSYPPNEIRKEIKKYILHLSRTRPTAVNLFWAIDQMENVMERECAQFDELASELYRKAVEIHESDIRNNELIGTYGASILGECRNILTHCNAGALATGGFGTAVGVIRSVHSLNPGLHVWVDETRPVLQGARLTAYELGKLNISHHVICDNMAGYLMSQRKVDGIVIGADRITSNGDAANKIGSYSLSVLARYHNIPFVVAAPRSTIDYSMASGAQIPIEQRDPTEIKEIGNRQITPRDSEVYNPAFDVVPAELITAIVTEQGVFRFPYSFKEV